MNHKKYMLILCLIVAGCSFLPGQRSTDQIFSRYNQLEKELVSIDNKYAGYFDGFCSSENGIIKINNAEVFFKNIEDWQKARKDKVIEFSDIYFDNKSTDIKEFKEKELVDDLIGLTKSLNEVRYGLDDSFLENVDCSYGYEAAQESYKKPLETKSCLISCQDIKSFAWQIRRLTSKEKQVISVVYDKIKSEK